MTTTKTAPKPATTTAASATTSKAKVETRTARLRRMLAAPEGASLAAICSTMGWQPHSARAALSGLRKAGDRIERGRPTEPGGSPIYRLVAEEEAEAEAPAGETVGRPA